MESGPGYAARFSSGATMSWILMFSIGAVFGGLFLGTRDLVPYLTARRSGVITRKGALGVRIRRDEDPDRFARLMANRSRGAAIGFGLSLLGAIVLCMFWLALAGTTAPYVILTYLVSFGFTVFAGYCLVRGLSTGRMFAFWSLIFFGEANRKESPIWFWTYAAINILIVLFGSSSLLAAFAR